MELTRDFWDGRRVFITGHTGFKGAWLVLWLSGLKASVTGYALAPPTKPSLYELAEVNRSIRSIQGDVRDLDRLKNSMRESEPEVVFHLAAQSLVRLSYNDPLTTFTTNTIGTINLLEACREAPQVRAIVIVTSDKCYEENGTGQPHGEDDALGGHDPYSASKACAEIAASAYRRSFFGAATSPAVATARAGNVIGGGDWAADRLLTDLVIAFMSGQRVRLRNPRATRPWQHVLDPLSGYLLLAERLFSEGQRYAEAWNFGPPPACNVSVETVAESAARLWGAPAAWESDTGSQPREAPLLALDASKAQRRLGWRPRLGLDTALAWTVAWYKGWHEGQDARRLAEDEIFRYMDVRPQ